MLKYCRDKWDKNEKLLEKALNYLSYKELYDLRYVDLVKLVVKWILNDGKDDNSGYWNCVKITCIDDGDYEGTQLYLIPKNTFQPSEYEYLMTYVGYGSCSGCDTLLSIQYEENNIKEFVQLCRDIICNIVKPYNCGWRNEEEFNIVEE